MRCFKDSLKSNRFSEALPEGGVGGLLGNPTKMHTNINIPKPKSEKKRVKFIDTLERC